LLKANEIIANGVKVEIRNYPTECSVKRRLQKRVNSFDNDK